MSVFASRKRFILGLVALVLIATVVAVGFVAKDRRGDEARCDSIQQQAEAIGKSGGKLLREADSVRGNANADESAKSGADELRSGGFLKARTAAHLMIDNKTCFSPSDVAYANTLLDTLDKIP